MCMSLIRMRFRDVLYSTRGKVLERNMFNFFGETYGSMIYHFQLLLSKFIRFKRGTMYAEEDAVEYWNAVESVNISTPSRINIFVEGTEE